MLDLMYRIPSDKSISRCVIDKDIVEDNLKLDGDCVPEAYIEEKRHRKYKAVFYKRYSIG